jgi:hypothetical protein
MAALGMEIYDDPTLVAMDRAIEAREARENAKPRPYLGASAIGHPCERKLWYGFRWSTVRTIPAKGCTAIEDGHRTEDLIAERLRLVPGLQLWTRDPDDEAKQIGFTDIGGHFRGNLDGILVGLVQAPVAPHVWESKACNEKKQAKLQDLKQTIGEKAALRSWDAVYYGQAIVYMGKMGIDRHYLTCASPGGRSVVAVRTDFDPVEYGKLIAKAERVIFAERPGPKLSEKPDWYECKFCEHHSVCHGGQLPEVNCRTCQYSTPTREGGWMCEKFGNDLSYDDQLAGCSAHLFHPDYVAGEPLEPGESHNAYRMRDGTVWTDGPK